MVAVDILEVPVSSNNNRYILVVQDYFTKWADARPIPDQTAVRITRELVHIFAGYGIPEIIHSDQGRNFESTIFNRQWQHLELRKHVPLPTIRKEMVWWNGLTVHYCSSFEPMWTNRMNGKNTCLLHCMPIELPPTHPNLCHPLN